MIPTDLDSLSKSELVSLAKKYTVYYVTKSGQGSTSNYEKLTKEELITLLREDRDYQKAVGELRRIDILKQRLKKTPGNPEDIMNVILDVFKDTSSPPIPGDYFTFKYIAKTPNILYDQHPLIACLSVFEWGFLGINFHLGMERSYTWPEVNSNIVLVKKNEISYMRSVRYKKLLMSS